MTLETLERDEENKKGGIMRVAAAVTHSGHWWWQRVMGWRVRMFVVLVAEEPKGIKCSPRKPEKESYGRLRWIVSLDLLQMRRGNAMNRNSIAAAG